MAERALVRLMRIHMEYGDKGVYLGGTSWGKEVIIDPELFDKIIADPVALAGLRDLMANSGQFIDTLKNSGQRDLIDFVTPLCRHIASHPELETRLLDAMEKNGLLRPPPAEVENDPNVLVTDADLDPDLDPDLGPDLGPDVIAAAIHVIEEGLNLAASDRRPAVTPPGIGV